MMHPEKPFAISPQLSPRKSSNLFARKALTPLSLAKNYKQQQLAFSALPFRLSMRRPKKSLMRIKASPQLKKSLTAMRLARRAINLYMPDLMFGYRSILSGLKTRQVL